MSEDLGLKTGEMAFHRHRGCLHVPWKGGDLRDDRDCFSGLP